MRTFPEFIDTLTWSPGYLDPSSFSAFLRAVSLRVDRAEAIQSVAERIKLAGGQLRMGKLRHQYQCALAYVSQHGGGHSQGAGSPGAWVAPDPKPALEPNHQIIRRVAGRVEADITPLWLRQRSPLGVSNLSPAEFLRVLYFPGEHVDIFTNPRTQGKLWPIPGRVRGDELDQYRRGNHGVWFLIAPVDGLEHLNERTNTDSRRSEESVTAWRYAILESDKVPAALWLKVLVQLPLPIAAIYSSGGSSVHALVLVNACTKADWDATMRSEGMKEVLAAFGVDIKALTAVRLSRLPQCVRGETGRLQELFFLNPEPTFRPLWS